MIITRDSAGLRPPKTTPRAMRTPRGVVVHCTAGNQPADAMNSLRRWQAVQRYHQQNRGWADIGYNFGFDDFGQLLEGRGWEVRGAHAKGLNATHHGICYLGTGEHPTSLALAALDDFIEQHDERYGVALEVFGHREVSSKRCPGDAIAEHLEQHYGCRNPHT